MPLMQLQCGSYRSVRLRNIAAMRMNYCLDPYKMRKNESHSENTICKSFDCFDRRLRLFEET